MVTVIRNQWKHTVGILIALQQGSCFEDEKSRGYTHIAEHLFFSGTDKMSRSDLRNIQDRIFNQLEATTGYKEVRIFCYVHKSDVNEALRVLQEAVFHWKCRKQDVQDEKADLLTEARTYRHSGDRRIRREIAQLLFSEPREILGPAEVIERLSVRDLPPIKRYWKTLLSKTNIDVCMLGPVGAKEVALAKHLFGKDNTIKKVRWTMADVVLRQSPRGVGISIKHNTRHPYLLFLGQVMASRIDDSMDECVSFESVQFNDQTLFCVVSDKSVDKKKALALLKKQLSKKEFETAKELFLKHFQFALDGVDPIDALHWFYGFRRRAYQSLPSENPKAVYDFYKQMSFGQVRDFYNEVLLVLESK